MKINFDYDLLRQKREAIEPSLSAYAARVGLSKGAVSKIETGYGSGRAALEKYLGGMALEIEEVRLNRVFEYLSAPTLALPKSINFRPLYWPNPYSDRWRERPFGLVPIGLKVFGGESSTRVENMRITLEAQPELALPQIKFTWFYWVRLDNSPRPEDPDPNAIWRGEYDAFGDGATVNARALTVGQELSKEILFKPDNGIPWRDFAATFTDDVIDIPDNLVLKFRLDVEWFERRGTRVLSEAFSVPAACLNRGFKMTSRNDLKLAKYLQIRTVEGGKNVCGNSCC